MTSLNEELDLSNRNLSAIPPEVFATTSLRRLVLRGNQIRVIDSRIRELSLLEDLDLGSNQIERITPEVGSLRLLTRLYLKDNKIATLPIEIGRLSQLRILNVRDNRLETLPPTIGELQSLQELYLNNNRLSALPAEICELTELQLLDLGGNPQLPYLEEVLKNTSDPLSIIRYLKHDVFAIKEDAVPLCEAKILMIGQGGAGKTSIVRRLVGEGFNQAEGETPGINIRGVALGKTAGPQMVANIWDFGGQEIMHATHQFFFSKRSLYVLVLDSRQGDYEGRIVEYWLKLIQGLGANSPVIVVCNKCDENPMALDWTGLLIKYPFIKHFVRRVSCSTDEGIDDLRAVIEQEVARLDHVKDKIPRSWLAVKRDLVRMNVNYVSYERYQATCTMHGVASEAEQATLVALLHDLGVVLHFRDDPALNSVGVLNPNWATAGVYRVLNSQIVDDQSGIVSRDDLRRILGTTHGYAEKLDFILSLMRKFELCFEVDGDDSDGSCKYLIPNVLRRDEPDTGDWANGLRFQIQYGVLPNSVVSRFIVRMRSYISKGTYWRVGVVLASRDGTARALVKADLDSHRITIVVTGREESRSPLLNIIRTELRELARGIPGIDPQEYLAIPGHAGALVPYNYLLQLKTMGERYVVPPGVMERFAIDALLSGVDRKEFDVFLSYKVEDEPQIQLIARQLREATIVPWYECWELPPGSDIAAARDRAMNSCGTVALFIGKHGPGAWKQEEIRDLVRRFVTEGKGLIPVLLSSAPRDASTFDVEGAATKAVDFRRAETDPLADLIWGITGKRPDGWDYFIAYSSVDKDYADNLFEGLQKANAAVFLDRAYLWPGVRWQEQLRKEQDRARCTLVLVTETTEPAWYRGAECAHAIELAKNDGHRVVPILVGAAKAPYGLEHIQAIHHPADRTDFSQVIQMLASSPA